MTKPFLDIDGQIEKLKERKLSFTDENKAKEFLRTEVNYYKLNGYFHLFQDSNNTFKDKISFEDIAKIYSFDLNLRNKLLLYISIVEIAFKNYVSYIHAKKYGALGYLNENNFTDINNHMEFLNKKEDAVKKNEKKSFIKHHIENYDSQFPIWVLAEIMSFGDFSKFFKNMLDSDKQEICQKYYGFHIDYVENWIRCIVTLRNYCAHNMKLINTSFNEYIKLFRKEKRQITNNKLFAFILTIERLLPINYKQQFKQAIIELFNSFPISDTLDFPSNWNNLL